MTIIAMWSGPRNLSTAMMRSFGSRRDCRVMDEPFYAAYLAMTGSPHPMAADIIRVGETDPEKVAENCLSAAEKPVIYQKHMTHHMIEGMPRAWISKVINVFLLREPAQVIASYHAKRERPQLHDLGFEQQTELFDLITEQLGKTPIVVDSADILRSPEIMLKKLCSAIEIPFDPAMLTWPAGPQECDGIWGAHWYQSVWQSTGFSSPKEKPMPTLSEDLLALVKAADQHYQKLRPFRLKISTD